LGHVPTKKLGLADAPAEAGDVAFGLGDALAMTVGVNVAVEVAIEVAVEVADEFDAPAAPEDVVEAGPPDEQAVATMKLAASRKTTRARSIRAPH
jgi:hypothetical protein